MKRWPGECGRHWSPRWRPISQSLSKIFARPERRARALDVLLDRHVDQVAPLGPRAVVVLDVVLAEQLVEHEPGVRRALADAAVGDDRVAVGDHALAGVELLELLAGLERPVLPDGLRP